MFKNTITTSFFTTVNSKSFFDALGFILNPARRGEWQNGEYVNKVENSLFEYIYDKKNLENRIISFYNARSALFHALELIGVGAGDEVILQGYTCVSVANAIVQTGAKAIFVDIDTSLNINPELIEGKLTPRTRAVIIQHTFGNPADISKIQYICQENNIVLIEDCAQALGASYKGKKVGSFGDLSIFSFGRDKIISTVNGGFLLINRDRFLEKGNTIRKELKDLPNNIVFKNIFYLIISYISYKTYDFLEIGKILIYLARKLKLIPEIISRQEKECNDKTFFYAYPNALAYIGLSEITRIDTYNKQREEIGDYYTKELDISSLKVNEHADSVFLRYVIFLEFANDFIRNLKNEKILLGDRYQQVVAPYDANSQKAGYERGTCPVAEKLALMTVNLPCHPNISKRSMRHILNKIRKHI